MKSRSTVNRRVLQILMLVVAAVSGVTLVWMAFWAESPIALNLASGLVFTLALVVFLWLMFDPDFRAARQSDEVLQTASKMLDYAQEGMTLEAAQQICELLLPMTPAIAIAITDRDQVLGYAGYNSANNQPGEPIRTTATRQTLEDGKPRIIHNTDDIGLPMSSARIHAAIIQPLYIGQSIAGTLKYYYRRGSDINKTQESIAHGFAELLGTQMAAAQLEEQRKLATSLELKALQAQINPHFLFNTINTIASLIRTDPAKARVLLREFAVFYRSTLEDSEDLIPLDREIKQVARYFSFEVARFGEDRLELKIDIAPDVYAMLVPSFMIQPLVENAVKHAMPAEGKLTVWVTGVIEGENVIICIIDDGIGMDEDTLARMTDKESTTGLGIAVKNVQGRMYGYFGPESKMEITSELGKGTTVSFTLNRAIAAGAGFDADVQQSFVPEIPQPVVS